jgi:hypothetical protein
MTRDAACGRARMSVRVRAIKRTAPGISFCNGSDTMFVFYFYVDLRDNDPLR